MFYYNNDWLPYIAQKDYSQAASTLPAGYVLVAIISTISVHSNFDICCAGGRSVYVNHIARISTWDKPDALPTG